jgi:hypothetical protein
MTRVTSIVAASILTLLGNAIASPIVKKEDLKASIIRRHEDSSEIRLSPTGEMLLQASDGTVTDAPSGGGGVSNDPCDREYKLGAAGSNDCPAGTVPIVHPEDCERAAALVKNDDGTAAGLSVLKKADGNLQNFTIHNGWVNPMPQPKNCLVWNGHVYYNPTETIPTAYEGQTLCEETKYPSGTGNTAAASACPTGYEAIMTYTECHLAFGCSSGYSGCSMPDFANAARHISTTEPKGCFREPNGCFNFNWVSAAPSGPFAPTADMLASVTGGKTATTMLHTVCKPTGSTVPGQLSEK